MDLYEWVNIFGNLAYMYACGSIQQLFRFTDLGATLDFSFCYRNELFVFSSNYEPDLHLNFES